jgi:hypothetical protein
MRSLLSTVLLLVVSINLSVGLAHAAAAARHAQPNNAAQFQSWMVGTISQPSYVPSSPDNWLGGSGSWSNGANWSAGEPGGTSDVTINTGNDNVALDVNAGINSLTLGGTTGGSMLASNSPSLTIADALTINHSGTLSLNGTGTLNAGGNAVNAGTINLSTGGSLSALNITNSGTINLLIGSVSANGTFTNSGSINGFDTNVDAANSTGNFTNSGTVGVSSVNVGGTLTNQGLFIAQNLNVGRDLMNQGGTVEGLSRGNLMTVLGRLTNSGTVDSSYGTAFFGSVNNLSGGTIKSGADSISGSVTNAGTILVDAVATGPFVFFGVGGSLTNSGYFGVAGSGDTSPSAGAASVNNSGTIELEYMGRLQANTTITNSGTIETGLQGPSSGANALQARTLTNLAGGIVSLGRTGDVGSFGYVSNAGMVSIANGATMNVSVGANATPGFLNSGALFINGGGTLFSTRTFTQTAGQTSVDGSLHISGNGIANFAGGSVYGNNGTIQANVFSNAAFNIGDMPMAVGALTIAGNYTQLANGSLTVDIASASQYDQLNVSGHSSLNGVLTVDLLNGYVPQIGNTFDVVNFSGSSGTFSMVVGLPINGQEHFVLEYNPTNLTLDVVAGPDNLDPATSSHHGSDQVYVTEADYSSGNVAPTISDPPGATVPEPGSATLLALGVIGVATRSRARTTDN